MAHYSAWPVQLTHAVIFNFNGAEETVLQASHGFITQHPWRPTIRAFINLEAAGSGGREMVFQTGPHHAWLAEAYAASAIYPHGSVFGQDIFQSGVIPSDTDFRIYRDYGAIPGIDIAFVANGYVYHTKLDTPQRIQPGCLQRCGENLAAVMSNLLASPILANPESHRHDHAVYFDVLGLFIIVYSFQTAFYLNSLVLIIAFVFLFTNYTLRAIFSSMFLLFKAFLLALITVLMLAVTLTFVLAKCMSWFSSVWLLAGLYVAPAVFAMCLVYSLYYRMMPSVSSSSTTTPSPPHSTLSPWLAHLLSLEHHAFVGSFCFWLSLLLLLHLFQVGSSYVPLTVVSFPLFTRLFLLALSRLVVVSPAVHVIITCLGLVAPTLLLSEIWVVLFKFFVPLMGRLGTEVPSDVVMAVFALFCVFTYLSLYLPLLVFDLPGAAEHEEGSGRVSIFGRGLAILKFTRSRFWWFLGVLATISFFSTIWIFPYGSETPKRVIVQHYERTFHAGSAPYLLGGEDQSHLHESGMWIIPFDYVGLPVIKPYHPLFAQAHHPECRGLYCNRPWYLPLRFLLPQYWDLPAPAFSSPNSIYPTSPLQLLNITLQSDPSGRLPSRRRLYFRATCTDHSALYLDAKANSSLLTSWSFESQLEHMTQDDIYFVFFASGTPQPTWEFWLEYADDQKPILLAMALHYVDEPATPLTHSITTSLPHWADVLTFHSVWHGYKF
eukprot:TRINITY_DN15182_c0_g1_i5.p1 TRINITY_DN15182_c0_g1~~TRINITY_DN15182_c0_g1_i5.p1  ORF type:complete len:736 (-),score=182.38 TRINITY_DN15182_c0_g1_i5:35-2191(-)